MTTGARPWIRVKVLSRESKGYWERQLPGPDAVWGRCRFLFDPEARDYDWLVVYDDLPPVGAERRSRRVEPLACPRQHTLLVTTEPSSIKTYGNAYTAQFGCVLTSQEAWALPHRERIYAQPALRWFYGIGADHQLPYARLAGMSPPAKTRDLSMVWSGKKERHTWHRRRYDFMCRIRAALPELDIYGRGARPLDDKAQALDAYRYHIAIENHVGPHHWTEKLADPFLGFALPFYYGCPNVADYFPEQSLIRIDIEDFDAALATIRAAIAGNEYEKRLPHILEARRRVLEEYNFMAVVSREIEQRHTRSIEPARAPGAILSRYALRTQHPVLALRQLYEKGRTRFFHALRSRAQ
ncbi:MAG: glycosyltransferase family 10 domain-containing protein [Gammaproteobacteria bacterium]